MYAKEVTQTSKSALLELCLSLRRYHDDIVLAGGWAPFFIVDGHFPHCGSIDVDLALRARIMPKYDSIRKSVIGLGYVAENPFRFSRTLKSPVDGNDYEIHLDFLCDKKGSKYITLKVQPDLEAFAFDGIDLGFAFNFEQEIDALLPNDGEAKIRVKVVDLVSSLALKGRAMDGRFKPKDAYDIFALTYYGGGLEQAAEYFNKTVSAKRLSVQNRLFLEHSLTVIREKFKNSNQVGPFQVETFTDGKYERLAVAMQVNAFLNALDSKGKALAGGLK